MKVRARLSSVVSLRRASKVSSIISSYGSLTVLPSRETSLSGLPEEILLDILLYIRHISDQSSFASCLLCCRRWYRICQPLLYRDVVLFSGSKNPETNDEYARKDRARLGVRVDSFTTAAPSNVQLIRSITIRTASCNIDWPKWRPLKILDRRRSERNHWYPSLLRTVPLLQNLTSFSLKIGDNSARVYWTPQGKVTDILDVLPLSVVNLEVDTMGADFATAGPSSSPSHICAALGRLLPRLRNVRLRLRFLCEDMFDLLDGQREGDEEDSPEANDITSDLRSAAILFTPRLGTVGSQSSLLQTRLCGTFERPQHGEVFDLMSRRCKDLCASGKFPHLQTFKLVDRTHGAADGMGYEVYDPINDEEQLVTWVTCAAGIAEDALEGVELEGGPAPPGSRSFERWQRKLANLAEGNAAWFDTSWQSRLP